MATNGYLTVPATAASLLVQLVADDERKRLEAIARAWSYYHGDAPKQLKVRDGVDDNVRVNVVAVVVDASVDALWGEAFQFSLELPEPEPADDDGEGPDPEQDTDPRQAYLDGVWDRNRRMSLLHDLALNGAMAGSAIAMIVPGPEPIRVGEPSTYPRILNLDPSTVTARWNQDDLDDVREYVVTWNIIDPDGRPAVRRKLVTRDDGGASWTITDLVAYGSGRFQQLGEPVAWPYPWPPIVACKNLPAPNEWWGSSDVNAGLLAQQDAINAVLSNSRRVTRLHGHPKVWASGISGDSDLNVGPDEAIVLPDSESRVGTLGPGAVIDQHLSLYERLTDALFAEARIPPVAAGKLDNIGQLSGLALRILYGPLVRKTATKRRSYGEMIAELNARLLELAGLEYAPTVPAWQEVAPQDQLELAQTAQALQDVGVSKATTLRELGYDPDTEAERRAEEGSSSVDAARTMFAQGVDAPDLTG